MEHSEVVSVLLGCITLLDTINERLDEVQGSELRDYCSKQMIGWARDKTGGARAWLETALSWENV